MQAFILAAGLGTRLQPLTNTRPKALVEIQGEPLIKIVINNLARQGATRIVVNIHHFADQMLNYLQERDWGTELIISDERDLLLDTGGGLKKAAPFFSPNEPILIHNVDVLSRLNFTEIIKQHIDSMNIATLVTSQRSTSRYLLFDNQQQLAGWQNCKTDEIRWVRQPITDYKKMAFSGIAIVQPHILDLLPSATHPYPIIPAYLEIAKDHSIRYFEHPSEAWLDVGKPETLRLAQSWRINP